MSRGASLAAAFSLLLSAGPVFASVVITWPGSTPEWNKRLHVEELRLGCGYEVPRCLASMRRKFRDEGETRATLAIIGDPQKVVADTAAYSAESLTDPRLRGVGIDDFVSVLTHWSKDGLLPDGATPTLRRILAAAKGRNPRLEFGITLYENELDSRLLRDESLPPDVRAGIGRVTLYLHFRENGVHYPDYVRQVRRIFPNAKVIAGIYAYDRIDYSPCGSKGGPPCSPQRELSLFQDALRVQMRLLAANELDGIELYPGFFGAEQTWKAWTNPKICRPERRAECLAITLQMREMVAAVVAPGIKSP